ncbi:MAG: alpha/beta fold hydrolase [Clostridia bacterium]|nr:alpha/beta fold hydrolase [Clostridia bacterium]
MEEEKKKSSEKKVAAEKAVDKEQKIKKPAAAKTPEKEITKKESKAPTKKVTKTATKETSKKPTAKKASSKTEKVKVVETKEVSPKNETKNEAKPSEKSAKVPTKPVAETDEKPKKATKNAGKPKKVAKKKGKTENQVEIKEENPRNVKVLGYHNLELNTYIYDNLPLTAKGVVLIVHGMQEHCMRYQHFAEFLNANGYIVVASDLRGHGHTAESKERLGYGEKDIFTETLKDQLSIIESIHVTYDLPIYLFGHSYGSMLAQNLIQMTPFVEKAVICGTTNGSSPLFHLGSMVISLMSPFKKKDKRGGLVEAMCIKSYGKKFERGNWLSRDEKVFDEYQKDEYCGGSFPFSFYRSMIKNMTKTNNGMGKIGNKKLFLIAGDKDPVGENGKQVKKLHKIYLKNNIDAKIKIYNGARHELLNEINKEEVYQDVLDFFNN